MNNVNLIFPPQYNLLSLCFLRVSLENGETVYQLHVHASRWELSETGIILKKRLLALRKQSPKYPPPPLFLQLGQTKSNLHRVHASAIRFLLIHSTQQMISAHSRVGVSLPGSLKKKIVFQLSSCFLDSS